MRRRPPQTHTVARSPPTMTGSQCPGWSRAETPPRFWALVFCVLLCLSFPMCKMGLCLGGRCVWDMLGRAGAVPPPVVTTAMARVDGCRLWGALCPLKRCIQDLTPGPTNGTLCGWLCH